MEHLLLKAATTAATDQGTFEAVISTPTVDRDKDIVEPSAMVNALKKWAALGKFVPLAWAHTEDVVGHVDASTVKVANGEVIVQGWVDQSTEKGAETWRLVKSGTLSFSFGYLIPDGGATKRPGGRFHIKELDVFEISVVPVAPANNDTRVLGWKSAEDPEPTPEPDPEALRKEAERVAREVEATSLPEVPEPEPAEPEPEIDLVKEIQEVKDRLAASEKALEDLTKKAEVADKEPSARSADPLRQQAEAVALEVASGGLPKPPKTVEAKRKEPSIPLDELKQRCRDEMLGVLSGGLNEQV
jgi:HK97 family phage prohead protease